MAKEYSKALAARIEEFLENDEWNFESVDERGCIRFGLKLKNKLKNVRFIINVQKDGYIVNCVLPVGGGEDTAVALTEFINRANYGMSYGNFEMDMRDYEIQFRTNHFCGDVLPTDDQIHHSIYLNAAMVERYGDALLSVNFGVMSPEAAIEQAEA